MKVNKGYIAIGLIIAFTLLFGLAANADESDQSTTITFSQPIQIPGQVLPAGTYLFKLANRDTNQKIVQVFNAGGTFLYATLQTIATDRPEPTGHTEITLAGQAPGQPDVLLKWFYPGLETGNEFLYPKQTEKELTQAKHETIVVDHSVTSSLDATEAGN